MTHNLASVSGWIAWKSLTYIGEKRRAKMRFGVSSPEWWKDKDTGEFKRGSNVVMCQAWGHLAESIERRTEKGTFVVVWGKNKCDVWQKDGKNMYRQYLYVDGLDMPPDTPKWKKPPRDRYSTADEFERRHPEGIQHVRTRRE